MRHFKITSFRAASAAFLVAALTCLSVSSCVPSSSEHELLIGTYTSRGGDGVYKVRFDERTGEFSGLMPYVSITNPSYLCLAKGCAAESCEGSCSGRCSGRSRTIFAVSETSDDAAHVALIGSEACCEEGGCNGSCGEDGGCESGRILGTALTGGEDPCYISTDGRILLSANYTGGSLSVFQIGHDGALTRTQLISGSIGGPDMSRQDAAHVHCCIFSPDGRKVLASDFSADRILSFDVVRCEGCGEGCEDGGEGCEDVGEGCGKGSAPEYLVPSGITELESDCGPRHIIFGNDSTVYVIGELSGNITVLRYNDGAMTPLQTIEADPAHTRASADIRLSPDGKFLYASNRKGEDGVAVFEVCNDTLNYIGYTRTAANPRNIAVSPDGKFLLVASQDDDLIEVYSRNAKTGLLSPTSSKLHVPMPVCLLFRN